MLHCHLCSEQFVSNGGGQLTNHLRDIHDLSLADHVIITQLNSIEPRCACGLCEERPEFVRGSFKEYAVFHRRFDVREQLYREKFGEPKCAACGNFVGFARGTPKKSCSQRCAISGKCFSDPNVQQKIKDVVIAKYGVDNVSKLDSVKRKISKSSVGKHHVSHSVETKHLISKTMKLKWLEESFRNRISSAIRVGVNTDKERARRSAQMTLQMNDHSFREHVWYSSQNRMSKLHQKIRTYLKLDELGFVSEQRIGRRFVDELNERAKIIVEVNGDYTHANSKFFKADDVIKLRGQCYTAIEKWKADERRRSELNARGYHVITVWESDDLDVMKQDLTCILRRHDPARQNQSQAASSVAIGSNSNA